MLSDAISIASTGSFQTDSGPTNRARYTHTNSGSSRPAISVGTARGRLVERADQGELERLPVALLGPVFALAAGSPVRGRVVGQIPGASVFVVVVRRLTGT